MLEDTVRSLQETLANVSHYPFQSSPSPPVRSISETDGDEDSMGAFAEQIAKLLVDPAGHARTSHSYLFVY